MPFLTLSTLELLWKTRGYFQLLHIPCFYVTFIFFSSIFFRLINAEMRQETRTARAFEGIECATDVVPVDHNIWMYPILGQSNEQ